MLELWTIFDSPIDLPDRFVARKWVMETPTSELLQDKTLEGLRARGKVLAVGFAFAAQEMAEVPIEPTDQKLDVMVTEMGVRRF